MKYVAILGRMPEISMAELRAQFGEIKKVKIGNGEWAGVFETERRPEISRLGGTMKLGQKIGEDERKVLKLLEMEETHRLVIGLSDYSPRANTREVMKLALKWKKLLTKCGKSVRIVNTPINTPINTPKGAVLATATAHHNQLGEKAGHIEIIKLGQEFYVSRGTQNITAYAERDQKRPARDAKNGMLPPKLAQILINLNGEISSEGRVLDPFCGSGVVLQEAVLMGYKVYGTDLNPKMVSYSEKNLKWLEEVYLKKRGITETRKGARESENEKNPSGENGEAETTKIDYKIEVGDATKHRWSERIVAVAAEGYLGPPMSQPPTEIKLKSVKQECKEAVIGFLKNLAGQIESGTPVTLAVPAWLRPNGEYARLNLLDAAEGLGYNVRRELGYSDLLYYREGQIVAREIILLRKK